jgi:hypothetical protein
MISAAFGQIALIRRAWLEKYPQERRKDKPPLPAWFLASGVLTDDFGGAETGPEFPPIMGDFAYSWFRCSQRIPFILFFINVLAVLGCIGIVIGAVPSGSPLQQRVRIEIEKPGPGSKVKATFEIDRPSQELLKELDSALQVPSPATKP